MRSLYKAGPANWLTFLFSANSFSDLLDRIAYLTRLSRSDYEKGAAAEAGARGAGAPARPDAAAPRRPGAAAAGAGAEARRLPGSLQRPGDGRIRPRGAAAGPAGGPARNAGPGEAAGGRAGRREGRRQRRRPEGRRPGLRPGLPGCAGREGQHLRPWLGPWRGAGAVRRPGDGPGGHRLAPDHRQLLQRHQHRRSPQRDRARLPDRGG